MLVVTKQECNIKETNQQLCVDFCVCLEAVQSARTNLSLEGKMRRISYSEIQLMTNNFERVIGEGGFGVVYHAYLDDRQQVAVKVLSRSSSQGYKQFKAEVSCATILNT